MSSVTSLDRSALQTDELEVSWSFDDTIRGPYRVEIEGLGSVDLHHDASLGRILCLAYAQLSAGNSIQSSITCSPIKAFEILIFDQEKRILSARLKKTASFMSLPKVNNGYIAERGSLERMSQREQVQRTRELLHYIS